MQDTGNIYNLLQTVQKWAEEFQMNLFLKEKLIYLSCTRFNPLATANAKALP